MKRFVQYLAFAAIVAAELPEEDEDLSFVRSLTGNSSNATTAAPTSAPNTTAAPTAAPNTTAAPTSAPNTTAAPTTAAPTTAAPAANTTAAPTTETTAAPSGNTTAAPSSETTAAPTSETTAAPTSSNEGGGAGQTNEGGIPAATVSQEAAAANDAAFAAFNDTSVSTSEAESVNLTSIVTASDPFECIDTDSCAAATTVAAAGNSTRRQLASHLASVTAAHNLFCGAFSLTASYAVCSAMTDAQLTAVFGAAPTGKKAVDMCTIVLSSGYQHGSGKCSDTLAASAGVCYGNTHYAAQTAAVAGGGAMKFGTTSACTKASGAGASRSFATSTSMALPKWKLASDTSLTAVDLTAVKSAAETTASSADATAMIQGAMLLAAVEIAADPASAAVMDENSGLGVNLTASLGITEADFAALKTAVASNAGTLSVTDLTAADGGALGSALTTAKAKVATAMPVTVSGGGGGGSTSSAVMIGSSAALMGLVSLLF